MTTYPAEFADSLCAHIERAKRGKANKTRAYRQALKRLLDKRNDRTLNDGEVYLAFQAITACAWAEGADYDYLDFQRMQARHHLNRAEK